MKKKTTYLLVFVVMIFILFFLLNKVNTADPRVKGVILNIVPEKLLISTQVLYRNQLIINHRNAYKQSMLPENNYKSFNLEEKIVNISEGVRGYLSFYIDLYKDKLYIVDSKGNTSFVDKNNFESTQVIIKNNINIKEYERIIDIAIIDKKMYISAAMIDNNCAKHKVLTANINPANLFFEEIYSSNGCAQDNGKHIQSGRIIFHKLNGRDGILISSSDSDANMPNLDSQDSESSFGKILFMDFATKQTNIVASGLRNSQGLKSFNGRIFLTEHGPEGGDELNEADIGSNFGWPYSSYGAKYSSPQSKFLKNHEFYNSHEDFNFIEPIYAFVPSIGISELVFLDNEFYPQCQNCILVSSLNSRSLYFLRMSVNFDRVIFREKILVGERIRDVAYDIKNQIIYLALEGSGKIIKLSNSPI